MAARKRSVNRIDVDVRSMNSFAQMYANAETARILQIAIIPKRLQVMNVSRMLKLAVMTNISKKNFLFIFILLQIKNVDRQFILLPSLLI